MSGLVDIRPGWIIQDLRDIWLWDLRCICWRIWWLCRDQEWMRNAEETVNVVQRTLTWNNAHLTCWRKMVRVMHPPIVYVIKWHPWMNRVCRKALDVTELAHNPLRSVSDNNRPPADLSREARNQMKSQSSLSQSTDTHVVTPRRSPDQHCIPQLEESARITNTTGFTWKSYMLTKYTHIKTLL